MQTSTPEQIHITPRTPQFDFSSLEKVWMKEDIGTHFINALSILIPFCERTVNEILRKDLHLITDPDLKLEVQNMIKQEGRHSLIHREANVALFKHYKGLGFIEKLQQSTIKFIRSISTRSFERTLPIAFEHFASAVSREVMANQDKWVGDKKNAAVDFLVWHCLEELEHQSVCYDAYDAVETNRFSLIFSLLLWLPMTAFTVYFTQLYLLHKDKIIYKPKNWIPYWKMVFRTLPLFYRGTFKVFGKKNQLWSDSDKALYQETLDQYNHSTSK